MEGERNSRAQENTRSRSASGMTLIEVMLSVVILSLGLSVLLTGTSRCLAIIKMSREHQDAVAHLYRKQLEFPMLGTDDPEDMDVDDVDDNGYEFIRRVRPEDESQEKTEDRLFVVTDTVKWEDEGRKGEEEVVRLIFEPASGSI